MKNETTIDAISRRAAAVTSRRASLRTLGAAGLAATLAGGAMAAEAKSGKNKSNKKCKKQKKQCTQAVTSYCNQQNGLGPACEEDLKPCCTSFKKCKANAGLTCMLEKLDYPIL